MAETRANNGNSDLEAGLAGACSRLARLARLRGVALDAVDDVVQETLLEAWKHRERVHTPSGLALWLDEICRNVSRRHAHRRSVEERHRGSLQAPFAGACHEPGGEEDVPASLLAQLPDPDLADLSLALCRQEVVQMLARACSRLEENARQVVELCYLQEMPQREAAARLGITISALEARLHRARRQLRAVLAGPLRADALALGLVLGPERSGGWRDTPLWCPLCGQHHLLGMFLPQPTGGQNLHMSCPDCERRYGLIDVQSSTVHSKGLVSLDGLSSFRPAWKRTMRELAHQYRKALQDGRRRCPYCDAPAGLQLIETHETAVVPQVGLLPPGLNEHPYRFWLWWKCPNGHRSYGSDSGVFAASDVVYWEHERAQAFIADHPHWANESELLVEHGGQPAIRFQLADRQSSDRLILLAHRESLRVLAEFP